jgi:ribonuclease-3
MKGLEKDLGYKFKDASLLSKALTHPSAVIHGQGVDFERLEFLGDRVLGIVVASWLFEEFPKEQEGDLAKRFAALVRKETLVEVATTLNLKIHMVMKNERSTSEVKRLNTLLSDGCEALIAALYLDGGLEAASQFIHRYWSDYLKDALEPPRDAKSILQEWVQSKGKSHPIYRVVELTGPAHSPHFVVVVEVEGMDPVRGKGSSKRDAEKIAAQNMLDKIFAHD